MCKDCIHCIDVQCFQGDYIMTNMVKWSTSYIQAIFEINRLSRFVQPLTKVIGYASVDLTVHPPRNCRW